MRIKQLSAIVANQIAAGEVIERPASIVKELLENSQDAKADNITIDIGYGGLNQVKISDNGLGIVAEDLPLAVAAHATSKITKLMDLYSLTSMGFRGEALASIASVARLSIISRPPQQAHGMKLEYHNDQLILTPHARNQGTTIDVRDIFYNAPVRKKFLKSERSEFLVIEQVAKRFALSASNITMQLNHNGKLQWQLPAAVDEHSRLMRITKILGRQFVDRSHVINTHHAGMHLQGWISGIDYQRSQNDKIWVYINGRMVKDKLINHAIKQAYDNLLYPGRHPACLLYLTINPAELDVNVHPTKHEVRFQQPRLIHDFITAEIRQVMQPLDSGVKNYQPFEQQALKPLEVREVCEVKPSVHYQRLEENATEWKKINERFVLLSLNQQPYIVDLPEVKKQWLYIALKAEQLPLTSRPLLVPVHLDMPLVKALSFPNIQQMLAQAGIKINVAIDGQLQILSIPVLVQNLDLNAFFIDFFAQMPASSDQLLYLLAEHQIADNEVSADYRKEIISYLQTTLEQAGKPASFIKHLSMQICQDLLNA